MSTASDDRQRPPTVAILFNAVAPGAPPEERDVEVQAEVVATALASRGHRVARVPCTLDLESLRAGLQRERPGLVFNLVEALGGSDRLAPLVPALLEALAIPYTGSPAGALLATADKLATKRELARAGLPTPAWVEVPSASPEASPGRCGEPIAPCWPGRFILKTRFEHASFAIDDGAVVEAEQRGELEELIRRRAKRLRRACFAEAFIDGREFNLSLLAGPKGPEVLPCAEIDFTAFPPAKPRIVGYRAKWAHDSFEYRMTPRRFDFPAADQGLLKRLAELARRTWHYFGLKGYARVDFRVDDRGLPFILELNTNPCLSPDAGFAAALAQADIDFAAAVARIADDARRRPAEGRQLLPVDAGE